MPANKYTRSLYKTGTVASEKAAIANRDPARKAAAEKIMKREGTTSPAGGRAAVKMLPKIAPAEKRTLPAKANQPVEKRILPYKPAKPAKPVQVIRTTQMYKPTPSSKKR